MLNLFLGYILLIGYLEASLNEISIKNKHIHSIYFNTLNKMAGILQTEI